LELTVDVLPDVPQMVRGDPTRVRQVLMNLIGNAIKFTEQGEVDVSASVVARDGDQAAVQFRVRDTGIGISAEQLGTIFQEFTQADASMTRRYGGTGLGLAISRRLVALMGGELAVTSEVGRGSEFTFALTFPLEAGGQATARATVSLGGRRPRSPPPPAGGATVAGAGSGAPSPISPGPSLGRIWGKPGARSWPAPRRLRARPPSSPATPSPSRATRSESSWRRTTR